MAHPRAPRSIYLVERILAKTYSPAPVPVPVPVAVAVAVTPKMLGLAMFCIAFGTSLLVSATPPVPHYHAAQQVISTLNLSANPEKGYYAQTYESRVNVTFLAATVDGSLYTSTRSASTLIYYLLTGGEGNSLWHRHDADEVWHHYAGAPLRLETSWDKADVSGAAVTLGADVGGGQQPQAVVSAWEWQRARSLGAWTLVGTTGKSFPRFMTSRSWLGNKYVICLFVAKKLIVRLGTYPCVVAPAFNETGYEIQQEGWEPQGTCGLGY